MALRFASSGLALLALVACQGTTPAPSLAMNGGSGGKPPTVMPLTEFGQHCMDLGMTREQCDDWSSSVLPDTLPDAKGNQYADNPKAAQLGYELFFDLEAIGTSDKPVRCAGCHTPERDFANNVALPVGVTRSLRNAPALTNAARTYPHFWDGRADSLWSQPLITIENVDEVNGTRLAVAHMITDRYKDEYEAIFGPLPDLSDMTRFPAQGKPGMPEWDNMPDDDHVTINRVYSNVGKAFEAYDRKLASGRSDLDRFILGDFTAMSATAQAGMAAFTKNGCRSCHSGPMFQDGSYHDLDIPLPTFAPSRAKVETDRGRGQGREYVLASEFNSLSVYYDRKSGEKSKEEEDVSPMPDGTFLTPSLRNVGDTGPYGHTGVFTSLEDTVRFILGGGGPNATELTARDVTDTDVANILDFLNSLHGDTAPLPWSFWPPLGGSAGGTNYVDASAPP